MNSIDPTLPPPMGHNNPPDLDRIHLEDETRQKALEPNALVEYENAVDAFLGVSREWLKQYPTIEDDETAQHLTDQIGGLRQLRKKINAKRQAMKKVFDELARQVQEAFMPMIEKADRAIKVLSGKQGAYLAMKQQKADEERRAAEEKARLERMEAEEALQRAAESDDIAAQVDAEKALKAAEKEAKRAAKPAKVNVSSASGAGRTVALVTVKTVRIIKPMALFLHYQKDPDILEALRVRAQRDVRAKDIDDASIPGIAIDIEQKAR